MMIQKMIKLIFQSTLPWREWPISYSCRIYIFPNFNPHSREGSDGVSVSNKKARKIFQSTLPRREWREKSMKPILIWQNFNPHSREGSDLIISKSILHISPLYFNPHSREGSDAFIVLKGLSGNIISIHTPAKGVTSYGMGKFFYSAQFQSTLPRREWHEINFDYMLESNQISIHTPAKGVTNPSTFLGLHSYLQISIHTPAKGVTCIRL